jgi:hypothetical protein
MRVDYGADLAANLGGLMYGGGGGGDGGSCSEDDEVR